MQDKDKDLSRRELIKRSAVGMGLLAILASPLLAGLDRVRALVNTSGIE